MYPQIVQEVVADPLRYAEHRLGTATKERLLLAWKLVRWKPYFRCGFRQVSVHVIEIRCDTRRDVTHKVWRTMLLSSYEFREKS